MNQGVDEVFVLAPSLRRLFVSCFPFTPPFSLI